MTHSDTFRQAGKGVAWALPQVSPPLRPSNDAEKQRFSDMLPQKSAESVPAPSDAGNTQKKTVDFNDEEAKRLWDTMTGQLSGMVATQAVLLHSIRFVAPDVFVVTFPSTQLLAKSYCENDMAKIQSLLRELSGVAIKVRFETVTLEEPKKATAKPPQNPALQRAKLATETADHPMVQKAVELFGAAITEVKPPQAKGG